MRKISNFEDLKAELSGIKIPVVGVTTSAFNRTGLDKYLPNYRILCIKNSRDLEILEKDFEILSLEKTSGEFKTNRSHLKLLRHKASLDFLGNLAKPHLLFYKVTANVERICDDNGWGIIGNRTSVFTDNKIKFRKAMEDLGIPVIPGEVSKINSMMYDKLSKKYGKCFVIQLQEESGGKGTFFIRSGEDFRRCKERVNERFGDTDVLVTELISGPSPSLTGCVTRHGILYTNLQYQLIDIPEVTNPKSGNGIFCGHDWGSSGDFKENVKKQAYRYAEVIGNYLKSRGYRGIFGLDMVMGRENVYVVELNPRLLGSFPVITMAQELNREPLLIGFHILEFLGSDYDLDAERVNELIKKPKSGAQLILFNKYGEFVRNRRSLKPGVYVMGNGELKYLRPGYKLGDLRGREEFLLADGTPLENTVFKPHGRIMKILTLGRIMDKKDYKLNEGMKKIVKRIYEKLDFVRTGKIIGFKKQNDYYEDY